MTNKETEKYSKNHLVFWNYVVWKQTAVNTEYKIHGDIGDIQEKIKLWSISSVKTSKHDAFTDFHVRYQEECHSGNLFEQVPQKQGKDDPEVAKKCMIRYLFSELPGFHKY